MHCRTNNFNESMFWAVGLVSTMTNNFIASSTSSSAAAQSTELNQSSPRTMKDTLLSKKILDIVRRARGTLPSGYDATTSSSSSSCSWSGGVLRQRRTLLQLQNAERQTVV